MSAEEFSTSVHKKEGRVSAAEMTGDGIVACTIRTHPCAGEARKLSRPSENEQRIQLPNSQMKKCAWE